MAHATGGDRSDGPFACLVRLFLARIFHGGEGGGELDVGTGSVLALLALPGSFVALLLMDKYSSLLQWLRGQSGFEAYAASIPDEYFFIVLSMAVTGFVAVWRWDSIFPDARDHCNLAHLPVSTTRIFVANLIAVLVFAAVVAIDVNLGSTILFPLIVSASQGTFSFLIRFTAAHALSIGAASVFTFFAVFAVMGVLMSILPRRVFRAMSVYVRVVIALALLSALLTSFAIPAMLGRLHSGAADPLRLLPPVWFLALCRSIRARVDPGWAGLTATALWSVAAAMAVALATYAISYGRYFIRAAETLDISSHTRAHLFPRVSRGFDRLLLRSPGQRACYHFVLRTLLRSERHSLLLGAFVGFPLILAAQALSTADPKSCFSASIPCAVVLSVPLIISYCLLFGARLVFELPVDPRANWVFRLLLDARGTETVSAARKLMLTFVAPLVGGCLLLYVYRWGWTVGLLHTLVTSLWSVSLIEILLLKFRKVPFTCSYPPFRSNTIPLLLLCLLGFLVYAPLTSEAENWALVRPVRMLLFAPLLATVWWVLRHVRSEMLDSDRHVIFEQEPIAVLERLNLSDAE